MTRSCFALALVLAPAAVSQTFSVTVPEVRLPWSVAELPSGDLAVLSGGVTNAVTIFDASGAPQRRFEVDARLYGFEQDAAGRLLVFGGKDPLPQLRSLDPGTGSAWSTSARDWSDQGADLALLTAGRPTADGGVIAVGEAYEAAFQASSTPVVRFDAAGNVLWARQLPKAGLPDVIELPDATLLLAVGLGTDGTYVWHLSSTGDVLWGKWRSNVSSIRLAQLPSGTVVLLTTAGAVVEMTPDATVLRARQLAPVQGTLAAWGLATTPDGGFLVAAGSTGALADHDAYVWRFDAAGELAWQRRIGGEGVQRATSVCACANGDVVFGGTSDDELWLVRLDASGSGGGCASAPFWVAPQALAWTWTSAGATTDVLPGADAAAAPFTDGTTPTASGACFSDALGTRVCTPANDNSSGAPAVMWAFGSDVVAENHITLAATDLPVAQFGYFLTGQTLGTSVPPGSQGVFCLAGGPAFRFSTPVLSTGALGSFGRTIDLSAIPGHGAVLPGETWYFQAWFRDKNPQTTSNFSDALEVVFS